MLTEVMAVPPEVAAKVPAAGLGAQLTPVVDPTVTGFPNASCSCTRIGPIDLPAVCAPETGPVAIVNWEAGPGVMARVPLVSAKALEVVQLALVNCSAPIANVEFPAGMAPLVLATVTVHVACEKSPIDVQVVGDPVAA